MELTESLDTLVSRIARMERAECVMEMRTIEQLPLDFTDEYLDAASLDQLRHLLLAAVVQARKHLSQRCVS